LPPFPFSAVEYHRPLQVAFLFFNALLIFPLAFNFLPSNSSPYFFFAIPAAGVFSSLGFPPP